MGYRNVQYGKKAQRRNYSKMRYDIELPNLIEIQTESFHWFVTEGLKQLFDELSPIESYNGDYKLYFLIIVLKIQIFNNGCEKKRY